MHLISLRGNTNGKDTQNENKPYVVSELLKTGLHCWVDVWYHEGKLYLGTDEPKYPVKPYFVNMFSLWCNAMNFETLIELKRLKAVNYFQYIGAPLLTNNGHILSDRIYDGWESTTVVITDDVIYTKLPLKGIISDNIHSFVES